MTDTIAIALNNTAEAWQHLRLGVDVDLVSDGRRVEGKILKMRVCKNRFCAPRNAKLVHLVVGENN